jgi:hypothetical protein
VIYVHVTISVFVGEKSQFESGIVTRGLSAQSHFRSHSYSHFSIELSDGINP